MMAIADAEAPARDADALLHGGGPGGSASELPTWTEPCSMSLVGKAIKTKIRNISAPYLVRQMSCVQTQQPGMRDVTFVIR